MIKLVSLNRNSEFKRLTKENKMNTNYFTMYFGKNLNVSKSNILNISFIMKKKIGNAVKRNKIKRKLRAAVIKSIKNKNIINLNYNYIMFGKSNVYDEKFTSIFEEVNNSFKKINKKKIN